MVDYKQYFKGKKITVMGLGLLGRGVGDTAFLAECGAQLTVTDLKTKEQLKESLKKLKKYKNIKYVLGEHRLEDFKNKYMILKNPDIPLDSVYIKEARKNKIPIEMSASLFVKLSGLKTIAVTGTRGKSTVTHLIAHILESAGKKIILGGNVRGVSNLQLLKNVKGGEMTVLELDSWQLQGFGDAKMSPNISVFTTFFSDHMKYYRGSMQKYFKDKANIFKFQQKNDVLVVGKQALPFIKKWQKENKERIKSKIITAGEKLPKNWKLNLPGVHNEYNAMLSVDVARLVNIPDDKIKKYLTTFIALPGRLEFLRSVSGIEIYNDNSSTTAEATLVALRALGKQKNIILIAGGFNKGLNMNDLIKEIPKYCKEVILLSGTGTELIKNKIKNSLEVDSMKKAVTEARALAKVGDIILLSPAFASFGMFKNEYDRGDQFVNLVKKLK